MGAIAGLYSYHLKTCVRFLCCIADLVDRLESLFIATFFSFASLRMFPTKSGHNLQGEHDRKGCFIFVTAGAITGAVTTPLDVIKTRLMIQVPYFSLNMRPLGSLIIKCMFHLSYRLL